MALSFPRLFRSALLAFAAGLGAAAAQPAPAPAPTPVPVPSPTHRRTSVEEMAQQRLAQLKQRLRITPAQEPAWDQFAQASMRDAAALDQAWRQRAAEIGSMNALQNMQSFAELQMRQARNFAALVQPFQQLYDELTPEQRQAADTMFRRTAERHERRGAGQG